MSGKTYRSLYREAAQIIESRFELSWIFYHATGIGRYDILKKGDELASQSQSDYLMMLCKQRFDGIPLQYILGEWEFYGLPFKVGEGVLIPRQDTEALVEAALDIARANSAKKVLDLCSGSGCIAIAIEKNLEAAEVTALEASEQAYKYLLKNIKLNNSNVMPVKEDLRQYKPSAGFDIIVSNPPYIRTGEINSLQSEVKNEPVMALDGGEDGLYFYTTIAEIYKEHINPGGAICFEIGIGQHEDVKNILLANGFKDINFKEDLNGIIRVVYGAKAV